MTMSKSWRPAVRGLGFACGLMAAATTAAGAPAAYPVMAPVSEYLIADHNAEIALARTAAPPSVSDKAEVFVLGPKGYVSAAAGSNGFVCMVQRAWFSGLEDPGFWNPKLRAPVCFNRQAARSVMPVFLTRTTWALSGASQAEIRSRTRAAMAAGTVPAPESGNLTFMLSKKGYLGDGPQGPWRPHVMFYMAPLPMAEWGADLAGTRVFGTEAGVDPWTMIYIPVAAWSDGSPDESPAARTGS
jgi:hypothetical protein